jgi:hypothetical protein
MGKRAKIAVIFDLDETIGHFWQIGKMWEGLKMLKGNKFGEKDFFKILDMFPHVFRPGIFNIFKYLREKKKKHRHFKVIIYSNNQGTPKWANMIKKYIEKKINYKLFDKVITAWKVNGVIYEKCRRTNEKTYSDILRCGNLNSDTKIFFVDDAYHPSMFHNQVDYYHIKPWKFGYNIENMVSKVIKKYKNKKIREDEVEKISVKLVENIKNQNWGYIRYTNKNTPSFKEKNLGVGLFVTIKTFVELNYKMSQKRKKRRKSKGTKRKYTLKN